MSGDALLLLPLIIVAAGSLACLAGEPFLRRQARHGILPWVGFGALVVAAIAQLLIAVPSGVIDLHGILAMDQARGWLVLAALATAAIGLAGLQHGLGRDGHAGGEGYALIMTATCGVLIMVQASDFLAAFVGLELASMSIYGLVGLRREKDAAVEGLFKYVVMGAVFSAIMLYGIALTYGATGSTAVAAGALEGRDGLLTLGRTLIVIGLLFKVGAVPFHFWSPDAYQGASVAATGFMAGAMKIGGFALLGNVWLGALAGAGQTGPAEIMSLADPVVIDQAARGALGTMPVVVIACGVLSIVIGNFSALNQTHLRRLMAFSSVAHAGYMLLAMTLPVEPGASLSLGSLWFYLVGYAVATSALMVIAGMGCDQDDDDALANLGERSSRLPYLAVGMTLLLASLAGIPPTAGFIGKFQVLGEVVARGQVATALIAMLGAVIGAIAYLRVTIAIWSGGRHAPADGAGLLVARPLVVIAGGIAVVAVVVLLLVPDLGRSAMVAPALVAP